MSARFQQKCGTRCRSDGLGSCDPPHPELPTHVESKKVSVHRRTLTSLTLQTVCSTKSIEPSKLNEQLQLVEIFWIQPGHWEQCKDWYTCQLKAPNVFFSKETHHLLHTLSIKKRSSKFLKCITDHEHPWQHTYLGYPKDLKILWLGILNLSRPACLMVN